jgi:hypothetical protein
MTTTLHSPARPSAEPMELLRGMLEERYTVDIARLTQLTVYAALPRHAGHDARTLQAQTTAVRQRIAETAHALQRMSEGTYGTCVNCHRPIPLGRLRAAPEAAHCASCGAWGPPGRSR